MTSSLPEADAAGSSAAAFVLDDPPADMGREGAYDVKEKKAADDDGKFSAGTPRRIRSRTFIGCSRTAPEVPIELFLLVGVN